MMFFFNPRWRFLIMQKKWGYFFCSLLLSHSLSAHPLYFSHLSDAEGLSQNTVRELYQDSKGMIWIGTEDGLNRYNGTYNEIFRHQSGDKNSLTSNTVYDIVEDSLQNIWVATLQGIDKWERANNRFIHFSPMSSEPLGYRIIGVGGQTVWGVTSERLYKITPGSQNLVFIPGIKIRTRFAYRFSPTQFMLISIMGECYLFDIKTEKISFFKQLPSKSVSCAYKGGSNLYWTDETNVIYQANDYLETQKVYSLPVLVNPQKGYNTIECLWEDEGVLYIGTSFNGLYVLDRLSQQLDHYFQELGKPHTLLDNRIITLYKAKNSTTLWVGTYGNGLNFCNLNQRFFHHSLPGANHSPDALASPFIFSFYEKNAQEVFIGTDGKGLEQWNPQTGKFIHWGDLGNSMMNRVMSLCMQDESTLLIGAFKGLFLWKIGEKTARSLPPPLPKHPLEHISTIAKAPNGDIWVAGEDRYEEAQTLNHNEQDANIWIYRARTQRWEYLLTERINPQIKHTLLPVYVFADAQRVYVLLNNEIYYQMQGESFMPLNISQLDNKSKITTLYPDGSGNLWFGTDEEGIVCYNFPTQKLYTFDKALADERINAILKDKQGDIWVSHDHGLSKLLPKTKRVIHFDIKDGLQSNEFIRRSALVLHDGSLLFGGVNGFNHFLPEDIATAFPQLPPPLSFIQLTALVKKKREAETEDIEVVQPFTLNADNQPVYTFSYRFRWEGWKPSIALEMGSLTFYYAAIAYLHPKRCKYRYRLQKKGESKTFEGTQQPQVRFPQTLDPGDYMFEVQAMNDAGIWSEPAKVHVSIQPHWTQTHVFRIVVSILAFLLAAYVIYQRIQMIRAKDAEEARIANEVAELKSKSLRAQMNPHFIFNALNSIQDFILDHNFRESAKYLTKFSRLIRLILDHSDTRFVLLANEVQLLVHYMDLEMLRFNDKFSYEIFLDAAIDKEKTLLPSMILQPYIENAIWHGLLHKGAGGYLKLSFEITPTNLLKCTLVDNGIGRAASFELSKKKGRTHKSRGMDISKQQIEILKQQHNCEISIILTDLKDADGNPTGTRVELLFPLMQTDNSETFTTA